MGALIMFNLMSVDGFMAGVDDDISWHRVDAEFEAFSIEQLRSAGGLVFGRRTYEMMAEFWPNEGTVVDPATATLMNALPKVVCSRTLTAAEWANSTVAREAGEAVRTLERGTGGNIFVFGSANLGTTLAGEGLIDEYRVLVNPVLLGAGKRLFPEGAPLPALELLGTRTFGNGNVLLRYRRGTSPP